MTPKNTLTCFHKLAAGRAQYRLPCASMGGPVPNGPRSQAQASSCPCPASSTTLALEEDPRLSWAEAGKSRKLPRFQDCLKICTSGHIPRSFHVTAKNSGGILSPVEIISRSGLRSDCGSFHKLLGPARGPGFLTTCVSLGRLRHLERGLVGCSSPRSPLEGSFRAWPSGSVDTRPKGAVPHNPPGGVFRERSRPVRGS